MKNGKGKNYEKTQEMEEVSIQIDELAFSYGNVGNVTTGADGNNGSSGC